jgi:hypothetical protein
MSDGQDEGGSPLSARVQELRREIASPLHSALARIRAAGRLAQLDPDFEAEGAAELCAYLDDESEDASRRLWAAEELMKLPRRAPAALAILTALMRDPAIGEYSRISAAVLLAGVSSPAAEEALDVCYHYVVDPKRTRKWDPAHALRKHDPARARRAAEIIERRMADSSVQAEMQDRNIYVLHCLGDEYKPAAVTMALRVLHDPKAGLAGLQYAVQQLRYLGSEHAQTAADELERIARDPGTPTSSLVSIATMLHDRDAAVAAMRRAVADPSLDPWSLHEAACYLGRDPQFHEEAAGIFRRILTSDATLGAWGLAAQRIACLGEGYEREGVAALRALAADPALSEMELRQLAGSLAEIGPQYREEAEGMLRL